MVGIHSIAASSHPSHREQGSEREVTSGSWTGRSRRADDRSSATIAATDAQCQRSAGMVRTLPQVVDVRATLAVAHRLLNNPPSVHAFPSIAEQWCHDVDQLVVAAIRIMREGGRSRQQRIRAPPWLRA
jgi:hypothetical protein